MFKEGIDFSSALKSAKENGYAEADPTADIEGHDSSRKLAIISSIAYDQFVDFRKIKTKGIGNLTLLDFQYAQKLNSTIKLIALSKKIENKIYACVRPMMINKSNPLSNVYDVFNAILITGDALGDVMFYGKGAGKFPTASAVVADIIDIVKSKDNPFNTEWILSESDNISDLDIFECKFFVRVGYNYLDAIKNDIIKTFDGVEWIELSDNKSSDYLSFVVPSIKEGDLIKGLNNLELLSTISEIKSIIPILEV